MPHPRGCKAFQRTFTSSFRVPYPNSRSVCTCWDRAGQPSRPRESENRSNAAYHPWSLPPLRNRAGRLWEVGRKRTLRRETSDASLTKPPRTFVLVKAGMFCHESALQGESSMRCAARRFAASFSFSSSHFCILHDGVLFPYLLRFLGRMRCAIGEEWNAARGAQGTPWRSPARSVDDASMPGARQASSTEHHSTTAQTGVIVTRPNK